MGLKEFVAGLVEKAKPRVKDVREKAIPIAEKTKKLGRKYGLYDPDRASLRVPRGTFTRPDPLFGDLRWYRHKRGRPPGRKRKKKRRSWGS